MSVASCRISLYSTVDVQLLRKDEKLPLLLYITQNKLERSRPKKRCWNASTFRHDVVAVHLVAAAARVAMVKRRRGGRGSGRAIRWRWPATLPTDPPHPWRSCTRASIISTTSLLSFLHKHRRTACPLTRFSARPQTTFSVQSSAIRYFW